VTAATATVGDGKVVSLKYTLRDDDGDVIDASEDGDPLAYLHGSDNIVPGLERQLTGKKLGDKLSCVVPPAEGYGVIEGPGPQPVPRASFPEDAELEEGMQFYARGPDGETMALWVVEVRQDTILVDANHPLAGATLHFDVEITAIRDATAEEKAHGHPHGEGGHHH
jgi:FKBP-type peptidyl-prolyl cis-trans isomerase SlyD